MSETSGAALRLLLLDRPWSQAWEYRADDVAPAAGRLEDLYVAAGRKTGSAAAVDRVQAALRDDLDVTSALDVAVDAGGEAARLAIRTLALQ